MSKSLESDIRGPTDDDKSLCKALFDNTSSERDCIMLCLKAFSDFCAALVGISVAVGLSIVVIAMTLTGADAGLD